jgi:hypothetical protein
MLIQDIKKVVFLQNVTVYHILKKGNKCANFLTKFGASSITNHFIYAPPLKDILDLVRCDVAGTYFPRE